MAKLRLRLKNKQEREPETGPIAYTLELKVIALTDNAGVVIGNGSGSVVLENITSAVAATLAVGTEFNCPVQV